MSDWKEAGLTFAIGGMASALTSLGGWLIFAQGLFDRLAKSSTNLEKLIDDRVIGHKTTLEMLSAIAEIKGSLDNLTREDWKLEREKMNDVHQLELKLKSLEGDVKFLEKLLGPRQ